MKSARSGQHLWGGDRGRGEAREEGRVKASLPWTVGSMAEPSVTWDVGGVDGSRGNTVAVQGSRLPWGLHVDVIH